MREKINFKTLPRIWDGKSNVEWLNEQFCFKKIGRNGYFLTFIKSVYSIVCRLFKCGRATGKVLVFNVCSAGAFAQKTWK